jgi:hypothetical protein
VLESAPLDVRAILGDYPIFRSDKTTMPLQAADLSAGWLREQSANILTGKDEGAPIWAGKASNLKCLGRLWTEDMLVEFCRIAAATKGDAYREQSS